MEKHKDEITAKNLELNHLRCEVKKREIENIKLGAQKEMLMHAYLQKDVGQQKALFVDSY